MSRHSPDEHRTKGIVCRGFGLLTSGCRRGQPSALVKALAWVGEREKHRICLHRDASPPRFGLDKRHRSARRSRRDRRRPGSAAAGLRRYGRSVIGAGTSTSSSEDQPGETRPLAGGRSRGRGARTLRDEAQRQEACSEIFTKITPATWCRGNDCHGSFGVMRHQTESHRHDRQAPCRPMVEQPGREFPPAIPTTGPGHAPVPAVAKSREFRSPSRLPSQPTPRPFGSIRTAPSPPAQFSRNGALLLSTGGARSARADRCRVGAISEIFLVCLTAPFPLLQDHSKDHPPGSDDGRSLLSGTSECRGPAA